MLGMPFAYRPLAATPRATRPFRAAAASGELGWAAWALSRQAKLNAWFWHGVGPNSGVYAWATLGNCVYVRKDDDTFVHIMQPDVYLAADDASRDSQSVEATTQWLDFGKPGKMKALTGIDCDTQNVTSVEVYVSAGGDRAGVLSETVAVGSNQGGWTYSGEIIPLQSAGTEFKLRFIGHPNTEVQINRVTLHWDEVQG